MRILKVICGILFLVGGLMIVLAVGFVEGSGKFYGWQVLIGFILMMPFVVVHDADYFERKEKTVREKDFEKKVKAFLDAQKCWYVKTWSNGVQREGIPDLLVCCNGFFLGVELKNETGNPSELQTYNIREIRNAAGIGIVLYPDQFPLFKQMVLELQKDVDKDEFWYWYKNQVKFKERRNAHGESV